MWLHEFRPERYRRVAAPDSLKNEKNCRDLKNVSKHAAELTQAISTTPVLTTSATEH